MSEAAAAPSVASAIEQSPSIESPQESAQPKSDSITKPTEVKKYKIDGKEVQLDPQALKSIAKSLGITEEVFIRDYGTSANATRKTQEVAQLRREVEQEKAKLLGMLDTLRGNPEQFWELAKNFGHDPEKLAEEKLWKKIQFERLSPEAKQALAEKQRADAAEQRLKDIDEQKKADEAKAFSAQAEEEIQSDVLKVVELVGRKPDATMLRRVAEIYESYILAKKTKPSHEYVVKKLGDMRRQEFLDDLHGLEVNEEFVNTHKGFVNKLQTYLVDQARKGTLPVNQPSSSAPSTQKAKPKRVSIDKFDELFDDLRS